MNGWANRETFAAMQAINTTPILKERIVLDGVEVALAEQAKNVFYTERGMLLDGVGSPEMLRIILDIGSLDRVDWDELADALYDDIKQGD